MRVIGENSSVAVGGMLVCYRDLREGAVGKQLHSRTAEPEGGLPAVVSAQTVQMPVQASDCSGRQEGVVQWQEDAPPIRQNPPMSAVRTVTGMQQQDKWRSLQ